MAVYSVNVNDHPLRLELGSVELELGAISRGWSLTKLTTSKGGLGELRVSDKILWGSEEPGTERPGCARVSSTSRDRADER